MKGVAVGEGFLVIGGEDFRIIDDCTGVWSSGGLGEREVGFEKKEGICGDEKEWLRFEQSTRAQPAKDERSSRCRWRG